MPFKKRPMKRALPKRRFQKRKPTIVVNRALSPVPQRYICKMKYSETITTTAQGLYQLNLNSIFDPNRTGVGHQPYGHDTYSTLYNRYRVISCGWRLQVNSQTNAIALGAVPANEVISFTSLSELRENPRSKYVLANAGGPAVTLTGKCYLPSLVGRNKAEYMASTNYQAQFGSSPTEFAILNIKTVNNADIDIAANVQVLLEYTVECFDVKNLAQS